MRLQKRWDVVRLDGLRINVCIQRALSIRAMTDVPQRDAVLLQYLQPLTVRHLRSRPEELTHDPPERVPILGVVLPLPERLRTRQRPEDQHPGLGVGDRSKAL
jgi:hypothetical protein